ncbi:DUF1365 domain-containing protein [Maricaulis sp. MIT060901]|uniref:DUF1365 domain-containing protein n=1 Tax=Maricaulis sp. MIT060901 TaxID=3096993 RepID=UPI00399BA848
MIPLPASLCDCVVGHTRHGPKAHSLRYSILSVLVDIEAETARGRRGWLWAVDRPALISLWSHDYGSGRVKLRDWVEQQLSAAGMVQPIGRIELLTVPRIFGLKFNPLSVFFAFDTRERFVGVIFEVSNFHSGRQAYAFAVDPNAGPDYRFKCAKDFFVSPFNPANRGEYHFRLRRDATSLRLCIQLEREGEKILSAVQTARLTPFSQSALRQALISHPFNTIKIVGGILIEAARLAIKGLPVFAPRRGTVDTRPRSV